MGKIFIRAFIWNNRKQDPFKMKYKIQKYFTNENVICQHISCLSVLTINFSRCF